MSSMGGKTQTISTPNPVDVARAKAIEAIGPYLLDYAYRGMRGIPSANQMYAADIAMNTNKQMAGRRGIAPGDPYLLQENNKLLESLMKPQSDALSTALALYQQPTTGGGTVESKYKPGPMDYIGPIAQIGLAMATGNPLAAAPAALNLGQSTFGGGGNNNFFGTTTGYAPDVKFNW